MGSGWGGGRGRVCISATRIDVFDCFTLLKLGVTAVWDLRAFIVYYLIW